MQTSVAIIGGGSFATALVKIFSNNTPQVFWWLRNEQTVAFINKYAHNPTYLTDVGIDTQRVKVTSDLLHAITSSQIIVLAIPSAFVADTLAHIDIALLKDKIIVSGIKGIVPQHNLIVGEYLHQQLNIPYNNIAVVTGPCHAEEIALERLSYLTVASQNNTVNETLQQLMQCRYVRITQSDDIYGTEYSAVMKNIMAIASGICHALYYGDNFQAVLISNASREIKRFIDAVHPVKRDINDSAYLGDLLVTAYSHFSRNRMFGNMMGKGYSVKLAQLEMNMIAEGYYAAKCIDELNQQAQVHLPICKAVYRICYEKMAPAVEIKLLTDQLN
jgi:glycerol-3-phosphate dehydrogenase (NAD(P)+)